MTTSISIRQKAIALLEQLPETQLAQVVEFLNRLNEESTQTSSSFTATSEEVLLRIIQRRLALDDQVRLNELRQRNQDGSLTEAEHQELLVYVEQVEKQDAERAAALIQLAQLRKVGLKTLVGEFLPANQAA